LQLAQLRTVDVLHCSTILASNTATLVTTLQNCSICNLRAAPPVKDIMSLFEALKGARVRR